MTMLLLPPPKTVSVSIPFSGWYESMHDQELDREIEYLFQDHNGDEITTEEANEIANDFWCKMDFSQFRLEYNKYYVDDFATLIDERAGFSLGLTFEYMQSPREYNFMTDKLWCTVPLSIMRNLYFDLILNGRDVLDRVMERRHKSRSGFHSFYSYDLTDWETQPLEMWDHNQWTTVFLAWLEFKEYWSDGEHYYDGDEYGIIEDYSGNGMTGNWLWQCIQEQPDLANRLDALRDKHSWEAANGTD